MIVASALLVVVAVATLIAGLFSTGTGLIIASMTSSGLALVALFGGIMQGKKKEAAIASPEPYAAARAHEALAVDPSPATPAAPASAPLAIGGATATDEADTTATDLEPLRVSRDGDDDAGAPDADADEDAGLPPLLLTDRPARKPAARKPAAKKAAAKKPAARKPAARKPAAKKPAAKKPAAKKPAAKKPAAKKPAARKPAARKPAARKPKPDAQ